MQQDASVYAASCIRRTGCGIITRVWLGRHFSPANRLNIIVYCETQPLNRFTSLVSDRFLFRLSRFILHNFTMVSIVGRYLHCTYTSDF